MAAILIWAVLLVPVTTSTAARQWIPVDAFRIDKLAIAQRLTLVDLHDAYRDQWMQHLPEQEVEVSIPPYSRTAPFGDQQAPTQRFDALDEHLMAQLIEAGLLSAEDAGAILMNRKRQRAIDDPVVLEMIGELAPTRVWDLLGGAPDSVFSSLERIELERRLVQRLVRLRRAVDEARQVWFEATRPLGTFVVDPAAPGADRMQLRTTALAWNEALEAAYRATAAYRRMLIELAARLDDRGLTGRACALQIRRALVGLPYDRFAAVALGEDALGVQSRATLKAYIDAGLQIDVDGASGPRLIPGSSRSHAGIEYNDIARAFKRVRIEFIDELSEHVEPVETTAAPAPRPLPSGRRVWPQVVSARAFVLKHGALPPLFSAESPLAGEAAALFEQWVNERDTLAALADRQAVDHVLGHRVRSGIDFSSADDVDDAVRWVWTMTARASTLDAGYLNQLQDLLDEGSTNIEHLEFVLLRTGCYPRHMTGGHDPLPGRRGSREDAIDILQVLDLASRPTLVGVFQERLPQLSALHVRMFRADVEYWHAILMAAARRQAPRPEEPDWASLEQLEPTRTEFEAELHAWRDEKIDAHARRSRKRQAATEARRALIRTQRQLIDDCVARGFPELLSAYDRVAFPGLRARYDAVLDQLESTMADPMVDRARREWIEERLLTALTDAYLVEGARAAESVLGAPGPAPWFEAMTADVETALAWLAGPLRGR